MAPFQVYQPAALDSKLPLGSRFGLGAWQINGRDFDPERMDVRPRHGSTERWTFVNRSNRVHPMHIHGFLFRMLERTSRPVDLADRLGWKDTVGVMPDETRATAREIVREVSYAGIWVKASSLSIEEQYEQHVALAWDIKRYSSAPPRW